MSEQTNVFLPAFGATALVAVLAVAALVPAGYYGLPLLQAHMLGAEAPPSAVFVQLKAETIADIRAVKTETLAEIKKVGGQMTAQAGGAALKPEIAELRAAVDSLKAGQQEIVQQLAGIAAAPKPMQAKLPKPAAVAPVKSTDRTHTIYFPKGIAHNAQIDADVAQVLPKLQAKAEGATCRVRVAGFADTLGNDDANLRLSQKRAEYVAAKLKAGGVAVDAVHSWGERRLKVRTLDGTDNSLNRRVVITQDCGVPVA
ncbi:MAG: OmpA family protein [Rhodospirillaceae bacterium]